MSRRQQAKDNLTWYFKKVFEKVGMEWTSDNTSEVEQIVDDIIQAAIEP